MKIANKKNRTANLLVLGLVVVFMTMATACGNRNDNNVTPDESQTESENGQNTTNDNNGENGTICT